MTCICSLVAWGAVVLKLGLVKRLRQVTSELPMNMENLF